MPVYNSSVLVAQSIQSVNNQTYSNWELIIIDDCSQDDTKEAVSKCIQDNPKIHLILNKVNSGPLVSRNIGIKYSSGQYIAFLDQDDLWPINKLEFQIKFMIDNNVGFTYTSYKKFSENKSLGRPIIPPKKYNLGKLLTNTGIALSSVVYDKHICGVVLFAPDKPYTEFSLYLRLLSMVREGHLVSDVLLFYRVSLSSMSSNKFMMSKMVWDNFRRSGFNRFLSLYFFINYAYNAIIRYIRF